MVHLSEPAIFAAAQAIFFECCVIADYPPALRAEQWLRQAEHYHHMARCAILAALPHLEQEQDPKGI